MFYSREDNSSNWYVVMRGSSKRYKDDDVEDENADIGPLPSNVDMDEAQNIRTDCIYMSNVAS